MPPWRRLQACDSGQDHSRRKAAAGTDDAAAAKATKSGSSLTVETWALTTFHPWSGKRTQVWLWRPVRSRPRTLNSKVDGREVAPEGQDLKTKTPLLDARAPAGRRTPVGMDLFEAVSRSRAGA